MHQVCPAKHDLRIRQSWNIKYKSAALGFGSAIHAGLAAWYRTGSLDEAHASIEEAWDPSVPSEDYRTLEKCRGVMTSYVQEYPSESFKIIGYGTDAVMVERTFTLSTGMFLPWCAACNHDNDHDECQQGRGACAHCGAGLEEIEYGGIFDTLIEFGKHVYVLEHKSTSQLGAYYFNQFKPNNQVTGYCWASGLLSGLPVAGAIVNAIGVYKASPTKFQRMPTARNDFEIAEWKRNVHSSCTEIKLHERVGYFPWRTQACTMYGTCEFHPVHSLNDPIHRQKRLEQDYIKDEWNYEERE